MFLACANFERHQRRNFSAIIIPNSVHDFDKKKVLEDGAIDNLNILSLAEHILYTLI